MTIQDDLLANETVHLVNVTRSYFTAVYAILLWDCVITAKVEWEHVWHSKQTVVKWIFLFLRYYTIIAQGISLGLVQANVTTEFCQKWYLAQPFLGMWSTLAADLILLLRLYAIWERNIFVLGFGLLGLVGMMIAQIFASLATVPIPLGSTGLTRFTCTAAPKPGSNLDLAMFLYPFCFDVAITLLTVWRALRFSRFVGTMSELLNRFVVGGVTYFFYISALNLLNVVFLLQKGDPAIEPINAGATLCFTSLFAQRLVLHLRGSVDHSMDPGSFGFTGSDDPASLGKPDDNGFSRWRSPSQRPTSMAIPITDRFAFLRPFRSGRRAPSRRFNAGMSPTELIHGPRMPPSQQSGATEVIIGREAFPGTASADGHAADWLKDTTPTSGPRHPPSVTSLADLAALEKGDITELSARHATKRGSGPNGGGTLNSPATLDSAVTSETAVQPLLRGEGQKQVRPSDGNEPSYPAYFRSNAAPNR